jgi:hypothetical protein
MARHPVEINVQTSSIESLPVSLEKRTREGFDFGLTSAQTDLFRVRDDCRMATTELGPLALRP